MKNFEILRKSKIFEDLSESECRAMMHCLKTRFKVFPKGSNIISQGEELNDVVMIVKGRARIESLDSLGDIHILDVLNDGDLFGLENAFSSNSISLNSLLTTEKTLVMFMDRHRLFNPCVNKCVRHDVLLKKIIKSMAENNVSYFEKFSHLNKKTIREKLLSYFNSMAKKENSNYFEIPFNKTELASYLAVDRSAMSTELKRMKEGGIIDYDKKQFHLIVKEN